MNFYKYAFKKILFALLGIFLITLFFYVLLSQFIINDKFNSEPLSKHFFAFLGSIFSNFGQVYNSSSFNNALEYFGYYFKYSLLFESITFILSIIFGYLLGILLAYKNGKISDAIISLLIFVFASIPVFVLAPLMIILAEYTDLPVNFVPIDSLNAGYMLLSLVLPISIILIVTVSFFAIVAKNAMLNILSKDYIKVLKTMGLSNKKIFLIGVFKNLIIETINRMLAVLVFIISLGIVMERIFQIPGQSLILTSAFTNGEINVLMCLVFYKAFVIFLFSTITEIIYDVLSVENNFNYHIKFRRPAKVVKGEI
ncbi:ABC transporter permease [Mycoplasmopsis bovis]|uniref:Oligopeptide ABC transporter permease n=3 Tax=Mycoplasmopsis bovis TaxID=28903 RepID=A0A059XZL8_MYCBV|nr:ABC transporter permease [Mycoplasmopsis bovis]AEI90219.1 oligopeptide transport system permease protein (OppB) [Mycoplasmopsis bovis Hubei-1]AFM51898.1 oligopeptide ABC transporter permease protein [Mycoplasmopsis bovis HB0801]AIA34084.1 oligopeptide ABC transporter permease [Mycoplasmopsis bovis CQ-W70]AKO50702.1 peptide ABC transporter permease [Mycoplasmopsis bovis]AMW25130.1 oligopeptide transport system permease OppB [Mycoplasmopsis bovis]